MRNYQKISECPPKLKTIIELVNLLPNDAEKIFDRICDGRTKISKDGVIIRDTAKEILNEKLVDYIFDHLPTFKAVERFKDLDKAKSVFHKIAEINRKYGAKKDIWVSGNRTNDVGRFFTLDYKNREFSILLSVSPEGFIKPSQSDLLEIFDNFDVPFYRIRACEICLKIFWAKRTDARTCSKPCSDTLSQRTYQNKNKDEINEQRRKNYLRKKELKEMRKKKNATL